jgi:hypothetical protein
LVIDLWDESGKRKTYYSDGLFLYSEDAATRPVDQEFLMKFTYVEPW